MESQQMSIAMEYLTDAAHMLHKSAPETAAHLMSQRRDLLYQNNLAPHDNQRQLVCGACGHIMMPGTGSTFRTQSLQKARRKPQSPRGNTKPMAKVITCGPCGGKTRVELAGPVAPVRYKSAKSQPAKPEPRAAPSVGPDQTKGGANAGSKKRAKSRKAGLQALLAGQRQQSSNLSLADFMKK